MRLRDVIAKLNELSPQHLAEPWDRVGLHVGDPAQAVRRGLLCIDLTEAVVAEAVKKKADLIVAYHPPIFQPLTALTTADWKQRVVRQVVRHGIAVYSPHTALDAAPGGVNDWLVSGVGEGRVDPIRRAKPQAAFKLVTFVPHEHADAVREALSAAGAGQIGDYTQCSYTSDGQGTFLGGEATNPAVGKRGRLERVAEARLEMVVPASRTSEVVAALWQAHPYEEPAFDLYPLEMSPRTDAGQGRVVTLDKAVTVSALVRRLKRHLGVRHVEVAAPRVPGAAGWIRRVGVCAGAGGSLLEEAGEIDAFVTGEMRHHDVLAAVQRGQTVILAGHTQTERPYLPVYRQHLGKATGRAVAWSVSRADHAPTRIV